MGKRRGDHINARYNSPGLDQNTCDGLISLVVWACLFISLPFSTNGYSTLWAFFSENRSISIYNNAEVCVVVIGKRNDEVSLLLFVLHAVGWLIIKLVGGVFFSSSAGESGLE